MTRRNLVLSVLLSLAAATPLFADTARYMVVTRGAVQPSRFAVIANAAGSVERRVRTFAHAGSFAADLTEAEAAELRRSPDVVSVEPVIRIRAMEVAPRAVTSNVVLETQIVPWGVSAIKAPDVWVATRGASVNVAVVDTGIDGTHPDLVHAWMGGHNAFNPEKPPLDDNGHGTHVAGIIAAADNAFGTVGVAPEVRLWAVKVLGFDGFGTDENLVAGLDWVIAKKKEIGGAWVANMSVGAPGGTEAQAQGIQRALDEGILLVAAAGNEGDPVLIYPAGYEGVISVGAVDSNLEAAEFSNHGQGLDLVAPGVAIPSPYLRGKLTAAEVVFPAETIKAFGITGSPFASVRASFVNCGYGRPEEFPPTVIGRIAVIQRGPRGPNAVPFSVKAKNARDAGAVAVIIYNDDDVTRPDYDKWTLRGNTDPQFENYQFPLTVAMSQVAGSKLLGNPATVTLSFRPEDYGVLHGTSMATSHVSGTVALLLALAPGTNAAEMERVLEHTTTDVSLNGWDVHTSWGMVNALKAAKLLAPGPLGSPATPPPPGKRRSAG